MSVTRNCKSLFVYLCKEFPFTFDQEQGTSLEKKQPNIYIYIYIRHARTRITQGVEQWGRITYQVRGHVLLSCGNHGKSRAFVLLRVQNVPCSRADVSRSFFCMLRFLQVCLHRALSPSLIPPPAPVRPRPPSLPRLPWALLGHSFAHFQSSACIDSLRYCSWQEAAHVRTAPQPTFNRAEGVWYERLVIMNLNIAVRSYFYSKHVVRYVILLIQRQHFRLQAFEYWQLETWTRNPTLPVGPAAHTIPLLCSVAFPSLHAVIRLTFTLKIVSGSFILTKLFCILFFFLKNS